MKKHSPFLIGFSLGTRSIGVAILRNGTLMHCKVLTFKQSWSKAKLKTILKKLGKIILTYQPNIIGIKTPTDSYCSHQLQTLITSFKDWLSSENRDYKLFTIHHLKAHCFPNEKSNKRSLVECIGNKYPALYHKYLKERMSKNTHYTKIFEATISAEILSISLD